MTKDNWIKAFDEKFPDTREEWENATSDDIKAFISQVEKDAIEKRTKLLEESFKHRTKPVINLDDEFKNCEICGYDHEYMVEDNENAYKVAHLKVELSQAIEKTKQELEKDEELSQQDIVDIINNHKCHWCNLGVWETAETIRVLDKVIRQKTNSSRKKVERKTEEKTNKRWVERLAKFSRMGEISEKEVLQDFIKNKSDLLEDKTH